jgi:hypothetical protein
VADEDVAAAESVLFLQVEDCGENIVDVVGMASIACWVVRAAWAGGVRWVGGEAVVDGCDAGDLVFFLRRGIVEEFLLGREEGGGCDFWVAPCASVDVDEENAPQDAIG